MFILPIKARVRASITADLQRGALEGIHIPSKVGNQERYLLSNRMNTPQEKEFGEYLSYSWQQQESQRVHTHKENRERCHTFFCEREVISWYLIFKIKRQLFNFYKHFWKWLVCSNQFKSQFPLTWLIALSATILRRSCGTDTIQWKRQYSQGCMWPNNTEEINLYFTVW